MSVARTAWLIARKDLRIEWKSRVITNQVVPFAGVTMVIFTIAVTGSVPRRRVWLLGTEIGSAISTIGWDRSHSWLSVTRLDGSIHGRLNRVSRVGSTSWVTTVGDRTVMCRWASGEPTMSTMITIRGDDPSPYGGFRLRPGDPA